MSRQSTRADIRGFRGVDSDAVVETVMACRLVVEYPCFGGRCQLVRDQPARMWRVAHVVLVSAVSRPNSGLGDVPPGGVRLGAELSVGGGG
jgi:hypothetical protein